MDLFDLLLYKGVAGDSGGGSSITVEPLTVTSNGTWSAEAVPSAESNSFGGA